MHMKLPDCNFSIKQIEDLIRFVTHDLRQSFVYFFTHSRFLVDGSFRLYIVDKELSFQIPIYSFKNEHQKKHSQNCLMREFYLDNKYFMNGLKPTTIPTFLNPMSSEETYVDRYITDDVVSVELASNYQFTFPFESAHCYSIGNDILSTPLSSNNDIDHNDNKMINVIKITNRLKRLQPQIFFTSIYHCILSCYYEEGSPQQLYQTQFF